MKRKKSSLDLIEKALDRSEAIETLVQQTSAMETQSYAFKQSGQELKRALWFKNVKLWICIGVLLVFIFIVILMIIGLILYWSDAFSGKSGGSSSST